MVRAIEGLLYSQVRRHNRDIYPIFFTKEVCCVFSLESPHRGDSNEFTQYTIFNLKRNIVLNLSNSQLWDLFQETQNRVRNSRGERAIGVRATEVLLYTCFTVFIGQL